VDLADDIFPETGFRKDPDAADSDERIEATKANIHLVRHGAIRLFTKRDDDAGDWVRSIDINPSQLLYGVERHPLAKGDLPLSLSILKDKVTPLLADPLDARHIVPGLVQDDDKEPVAYWSKVNTELLLAGIDIRCLHGLSHPDTGPADGATSKRIQFGDKQNDCVIRIKAAKWQSAGPQHGTQTVQGIRVCLILKGRILTGEFMPFGTTALIHDTSCLVAFHEPSIACVHQAVMARMEGTFLPVPPEWRDGAQGKRITNAKVMALVSQLTSMPLEELRAMDEEIRHPSESTSKRLNKDLATESSRLTPVPVATLFHPAAYASPASGCYHAADNIDPMIADAYGLTLTDYTHRTARR
jgi:hypothetical protein